MYASYIWHIRQHKCNIYVICVMYMSYISYNICHILASYMTITLISAAENVIYIIYDYSVIYALWFGDISWPLGDSSSGVTITKYNLAVIPPFFYIFCQKGLLVSYCKWSQIRSTYIFIRNIYASYGSCIRHIRLMQMPYSL